MKKYLLFALIVCATIKAGATDIGGVLGNMTLTKANSPYHVTKNLLIPQGVEVTVEPGVELYFPNLIYLQVDGSLISKGTVADSIYFKPEENAYVWGGIRFTDASKDFDEVTGKGSVVSYSSIVITNGDYVNFIYSQIAVSFQNCAPRISNNKILGGISAYETSGVTISKNRIYGSGGISAGYCNNLYIVENEIFSLLSDGISVYGGYGQVVFNNNIYDCRGGISFSGIYDGKIIGNYLHDIKGETDDNSGHGIWIGYINVIHFKYEALEIKCNTFRDIRKSNIALGCNLVPDIEHNNFLNYSRANIEIGPYGNDCSSSVASGQYLTVSLKNNYWNGLSDEEIDASFIDFEDDFNLKVKVFAVSNATDSLSYEEEACVPGAITSFKKSDASISNSITVFPNPSMGDALTFTSADCTIEEVTLVNALSQAEVTKGNKVETTFKGLVTAIVKTNKGIFNKKIIIY